MGRVGLVGWMAALAVMAGLLLLAGVQGGEAAAAGPAAVARTEEPVAVTGAEMALFEGAPLEDLAVYAYDGATWAAVPFQFDEVDAVGTYTVEDGLLDGNDELVLMAGDLGQQAGAGVWLGNGEAQGNPRYEIEAADPLDRAGQGWAYVYRSASLSPTLPADYVSWQPATSQVVAVSYTLGFAASHAGIEYLALNGQGGDVLDRSKIRIDATCYVGSLPLPITLTEDDLAGMLEVSPDIDGPVRVGGGDAGGAWWFYRGLYQSRLAMSLDDLVPPDPCTSITANWLRLSSDWLDPATTGMAPATYYDSNTTGGVAIDGNPDGVASSPPVSWTQVSGAHGSVVQVVDVSLGGGTLTNYYLDEGTIDPGDTGDGASFGDAGFRADAPAGQVTVEALTFVLWPGQGAVGGLYEAYYAHPLQVTATAQSLTVHRVYLPVVTRGYPGP
jgi:hypothetical protein